MEIIREDLVEALHVRVLDGIDGIAIEARQFCEVVSHVISSFSRHSGARQRVARMRAR
jgi:hypothetical protein